MKMGKRETKNKVDGQHQALHDQVWFGGSRLRREKMEDDGT